MGCPRPTPPAPRCSPLGLQLRRATRLLGNFFFSKKIFEQSGGHAAEALNSLKIFLENFLKEFESLGAAAPGTGRPPVAPVEL